MSILNGSAYADSGEIYQMALGNSIIKGAAKGNDIFWQEGSVIYNMVSVSPNPAAKNTDITIVISCNRQTNYVVTYNEYFSGISRNIISIDDMPDGTRQITFTVSFSSMGQRTVNTYGATQQSSSTQHRSVGYIAIPVTVTN